jgi:hypothetical protein
MPVSHVRAVRPDRHIGLGRHVEPAGSPGPSGPSSQPRQASCFPDVRPFRPSRVGGILWPVLFPPGWNERERGGRLVRDWRIGRRRKGTHPELCLAGCARITDASGIRLRCVPDVSGMLAGCLRDASRMHAEASLPVQASGLFCPAGDVRVRHSPGMPNQCLRSTRLRTYDRFSASGRAERMNAGCANRRSLSCRESFEGSFSALPLRDRRTDARRYWMFASNLLNET